MDVEGMIEDLILRELFDWSDEDEMFALAGLSMSANEVKLVCCFSFVLLYFLLTNSCCLYNFPKLLKDIHQVDG